MRVEWLESALLQFEAIVTHIADDKPKAAIKFRDAVNNKVLALAAFPSTGRVSHRVQGEDIRELAVHENYLVFYRFDAARVEIVAVIHAHQSWP